MVGLAELGDKTQLAVFCLASKTRSYLALLAGVVLAFVAADGLAILLGSYVSRLVAPIYISLSSGLLFLVFGVLTLRDSGADEASCTLTRPFASGFILVFLSELGDKTQIASGLFAARFNPYLVFIGVIAALTVLSAMAVFAGRFCVSHISRPLLSKIAGVLFLLTGLYCLKDLVSP